ncbi:50S ribosomal protein L29 [Candidatus Pacearchaeota archaeon]|nr:50S ribosomal protein L29 [Candidatus Pacearchaeota archaeon]
MAILRAKDVSKMDAKSRAEKLKDLKMELVKSSVTAQKAKGKTKEIKKAIARIFTFNASEKFGTLKKK